MDMVDINKFDSMKQMKLYKKKLEELIIHEPNNINTIIQINNIEDILENIINQKKSNKEWLDIILSIVNKRNQNYNIKYLNGIRNNIKWNVYILLKEGININNIAKDEVDGIIFMAPDLYSEYFKDNNFIVYDTFYGDNYLYLDNKRKINKFIRNAKINGLNNKEIEELEEILFNEYKKERSKNEKHRRF